MCDKWWDGLECKGHCVIFDSGFWGILCQMEARTRRDLRTARRGWMVGWTGVQEPLCDLDSGSRGIWCVNLMESRMQRVHRTARRGWMVGWTGAQETLCKFRQQLSGNIFSGLWKQGCGGYFGLQGEGGIYLCFNLFVFRDTSNTFVTAYRLQFNFNYITLHITLHYVSYYAFCLLSILTLCLIVSALMDFISFIFTLFLLFQYIYFVGGVCPWCLVFHFSCRSFRLAFIFGSSHFHLLHYLSFHRLHCFDSAPAEAPPLRLGHRCLRVPVQETYHQP